MISPPHSPPPWKCENQIASFYGFPLKSCTLDPPSAVILLHALVYFWKPPTPLGLFKTPARVCLVFTLPVRTNSKVRWLFAWGAKPHGTFWREACQCSVVDAHSVGGGVLGREAITNAWQYQPLALSPHLGFVWSDYMWRKSFALWCYRKTIFAMRALNPRD